MRKSHGFADVLDAAEHLPLDAQEELVEILQKRTNEQRREGLSKEIRAARLEHKRGRAKAATADGIMDEILS